MKRIILLCLCAVSIGWSQTPFELGYGVTIRSQLGGSLLNIGITFNAGNIFGLRAGILPFVAIIEGYAEVLLRAWNPVLDDQNQLSLYGVAGAEFASYLFVGEDSRFYGGLGVEWFNSETRLGSSMQIVLADHQFFAENPQTTVSLGFAFTYYDDYWIKFFSGTSESK